MNANQIIYDLTYWFDFSMRMVLNHPLFSLATLLVAYLFYQALGTLKLLGTLISFGLAAVTAILLKMLM
jgi:cytochrome c oxidase assembly factor CtaG